MSEFLRGVGAELHKAARHPIVIVVAVLFVFMAQDGARTATGLWAVQADVSAVSAAQYEGPCVEQVGVNCSFWDMDIETNRPFWENSTLSGAQAAALSTLGGAVTFASFRLGTGLGWLAIAMIAVVLVTGERHLGSASLSVLTAGGRLRLLGLKTAALTTLTAGLGIATAVVVFATQRVLAPTVALPDPPVPAWEQRSMIPVEPWGGWVNFPDVVGRVLVTLLIVTVVAGLACIVASFFTNRASASATFSGAYLTGLFVAENATALWLTPARTVSALLGLGGIGPRMFALPFWPTTVSGFDDLYTPRVDLAVPVGQAALWAGLAAVVTVAGAWWIRRSPAGLG